MFKKECILSSVKQSIVCRLLEFPSFEISKGKKKTKHLWEGLDLSRVVPQGAARPHPNEMGYSNKVLELIKHMYSVDHK